MITDDDYDDKDKDDMYDAALINLITNVPSFRWYIYMYVSTRPQWPEFIIFMSSTRRPVYLLAMENDM
jgi:hypothetical protein